MRPKDLTRDIQRIQRALDSIPAGHGGMGSSSADAGGALQYQADIQEFKTLFRQFIYALTDNDTSGVVQAVNSIERAAHRAQIRAGTITGVSSETSKVYAFLDDLINEVGESGGIYLARRVSQRFGMTVYDAAPLVKGWAESRNQNPDQS